MADSQTIPDPSPLAFRHVGLLYHPRLPESRVMAAEILDFIESLGATAWVDSSWSQETGKDRLAPLDLLIVLGGDGSLLRAARLATGRAVPILGVNLGRLGFLAEIQPAEWRDRVRQAFLGNYWIEERMMLHAVHLHQGQQVNVSEALNEVVISRGRLARLVRLETYIDGSFLTTYTADGLIVSTATGSTAYALAAGGPILPPELKNFVLVPLAPHLSLERAIVLPKGEAVRVQISTDHTAILTVDGQIEIELADGDELVFSASQSVGRFVRLQAKNYFYQTLMQRLARPQNRK
ncbi:MAG: NAD(+)/NADH kinase [Chloroflexota bacterium]